MASMSNFDDELFFYTRPHCMRVATNAIYIIYTIDISCIKQIINICREASALLCIKSYY